MALPASHPPKQEKSVVRSVAEQQAKKAASKVGRKILKKAGKVAAKVIKQVALKLVQLTGKLLVSILGGLGVPFLVIIGIILVLALVIMGVSAYSETTGDENIQPHKLSKEVYEYIQKKVDGSVDLNDPLQMAYKVPPAIIAATIQFEMMNGKGDDYKKTVDKMVEALKPEFNYQTFEEWTETKVKTCEYNQCITTSSKKKHKVSKLTDVTAWNGEQTITYKGKVSTWKKSTKETNTKETPSEKDSNTPTSMVTTSTRTKKYSKESETFDIDFTKLDTFLTSIGAEEADKKMVEFMYQFSTKLPLGFADWLDNGSGGAGFSMGNYGFDGTVIPGAGVPPQYMPIYRAAEKRFGVDWYTLAAEHYVETTFSTDHMMVSPVGAEGHFQFMPATWVGWSYDVGGGLVSKSLDITSLKVIKKGNGYGVDGNGDGKADPWNLEDSIFSAANYLSKNGYKKNPRKAIWHYNHEDWYINKILKYSQIFKDGATYVANPGSDIPLATKGSFMRPATGTVTSGFGGRWGKLHAGVDIGLGGRSNVPIVAVADGKVVRSYLSSSYGNCVIIQHNINNTQYQSLYAHMSTRFVSVNQKVKKGTQIGIMGNTGHTTGPHLHFEIHKPAWNFSKSNAINPVLVIPF
ncbi:peptidoglycan DD-metalloendopeptidase family protein [Fictibacillus sp. KIGAM418]|uniref:Peptidoglycan DD-metalloendopeptidase family protein n=1 Tax=Fictibacillus marinisediminis TaxID=2878389 RepID=A0A9X1XH00_9BACL|nr:peptidoglycan DD-metalloendopeptidase family protein [Fictibacillus marinisediminis]MCK6259523.1 peptidoglycan DD-metalloendopeptidase family protein [Fictibacillus marinisediminis]